MLVNWWALKDSGYLPKGLGGATEGDYHQKTISGFYEYDVKILDCQIILQGLHFGNLVHHIIFAEYLSDYEEIFIHHAVTNCLFFSSIMSN